MEKFVFFFCGNRCKKKKKKNPPPPPPPKKKRKIYRQSSGDVKFKDEKKNPQNSLMMLINEQVNEIKPQYYMQYENTIL